MGIRTGKDAKGEDTFLWRICHAIDEPPRMLAKNIGVSYAEIKPLLSAKHTSADYTQDDTWELIARYVDKKIGLFLAVRAELQRSMREDRIRKLARAEDFERLKRRRRKDVRDTPIHNR